MGADNDPDITVEEAAEPQAIGKFRILRRLATGGMGNIYVASLSGPGGFQKRLVLKLLREEYQNQPEYLRMFQQEAKVASQLNHPTIVQLFEYGMEEGIPYVAMELVEGASLDALVRRASRHGRALGPQLATYVGIQICDALEYAHSATDADGQALGVVHRDVSPGNVLLSMNGAVKLTDFGIAKLTAQPGGDSETQAGVIKGKYGYMAPEQARGQKLDGRADLFSLGVVLYEAAVGRRLFRRESDAETLMALLSDEIPKPTNVIPSFPVELENVLSRALARDRDRRFSTAADMRNALEGAARSMGGSFGGRDLRGVILELFPESSPQMQGGSPTPSGSHTRETIPMILSETWEPVATGGTGPKQPGAGPATAWWPWAVAGLLATAAFWWFMLRGG